MDGIGLENHRNSPGFSKFLHPNLGVVNLPYQITDLESQQPKWRGFQGPTVKCWKTTILQSPAENNVPLIPMDHPYPH
jgi:hypothetical protein